MSEEKKPLVSDEKIKIKLLYCAGFGQGIGYRQYQYHGRASFWFSVPTFSQSILNCRSSLQVVCARLRPRLPVPIISAIKTLNYNNKSL